MRKGGSTPIQITSIDNRPADAGSEVSAIQGVSPTHKGVDETAGNLVEHRG
jgi:hypothetical protein